LIVETAPSAACCHVTVFERLTVKSIYVSALSVASAVVLLPLPSSAQETPDTEPRIESVLVLGTRQAYRGDFDLLETPQADLRIDAGTLRQAGALNLDQALDLSASVARQNNFGGLWNAFAVRGFVGDENLPSNYLVNGFNAGRGFGGPRDLSGIETVEVLKGPRAALYGRGEPGGTINLVTKRPGGEAGGYLRLSAARFDSYRGDADWTTPLSNDVAIRLVGFYEDAGSFRDTVETLRYGASPSIAWHISERSELVYELEYSRQELPFDRGVIAIDNQLGVVPESRFLGEPGDGPLEAEVIGHQLEFQHDFDNNWSVLLGFNARDTALEGFSTEPELSGSRQLLFVDGETLTRQRRFRNYDASYRVFRAELSGSFRTGAIEHRVVFGADSDEFENDQVFRRARAPSLASNPTLEQLQAINVFDPVYGQYPLPEPAPLTDRVETQEAVGVFFQDQISLTERLDLRLGGRFDDYRQRLVNRASGSVSRVTETRFSPQAGLVYEVSDSLSVYAAYGENFRPLSGSDALGNGFDPNQSTSMEAGLKLLFMDGRAQATATVFRVEQDNILVVDDPSAFTLAAIGEAESQGLELDVSGDLGAGLSLWASYAWVDAETSKDFNDPNFGRPIPAGSRLLNIPEHSANLQLAKSLALGGRDLELGGGLLYVGERLGYFGTDFELPDYTLVRAYAAFEVSEALELRAEIDNLFDEEFYTNSFSDLWVQPGAPVSWRLSAEYRF
jgi:iron complex outermembrane receptor protein